MRGVARSDGELVALGVRAVRAGRRGAGTGAAGDGTRTGAAPDPGPVRTPRNSTSPPGTAPRHAVEAAACHGYDASPAMKHMVINKSLLEYEPPLLKKESVSRLL